MGCGGSFRVEFNQIKRYSGAGTYCSRTCKHRAQRGVELVTGTRYVGKNGYVVVKVGCRRRKLEHRLVMETILGRELTADEHVHHINRDRADNGPENLQVVSASEHAKLHPDWPQHQRSRVSLICHRCGQGYEKPLHRLGESKYCSNECRLVALHDGNRSTSRTAVP